jgi:hypothetical protein
MLPRPLGVSLYLREINGGSWGLLWGEEAMISLEALLSRDVMGLLEFVDIKILSLVIYGTILLTILVICHEHYCFAPIFPQFWATQC